MSDAKPSAPAVPLEEALRRLLFVCSQHSDATLLVAASDVARAVGLAWDPFEQIRADFDRQIGDVEECLPVSWFLPARGAIRLPPG